MSSNKLRFYEVTSSTIVQALNQADAEALANGRRGVTGKVLDADVTVSRITASDAQTFTA